MLFLRFNVGKIRDIRNLIKDKLYVNVIKLEKVLFYLKKLTDDEIKNIFDFKTISLSWNHDKILTVNDHSLMTNGVNYAWKSASNKYIIVEQSCKMRKNVAISIHAWMNYFFKWIHIFSFDTCLQLIYISTTWINLTKKIRVRLRKLSI